MIWRILWYVELYIKVKGGITINTNCWTPCSNVKCGFTKTWDKILRGKLLQTLANAVFPTDSLRAVSSAPWNSDPANQFSRNLSSRIAQHYIATSCLALYIGLCSIENEGVSCQITFLPITATILRNVALMTWLVALWHLCRISNAIERVGKKEEGKKDEQHPFHVLPAGDKYQITANNNSLHEKRLCASKMNHIITEIPQNILYSSLVAPKC